MMTAAEPSHRESPIEAIQAAYISVMRSPWLIVPCLDQVDDVERDHAPDDAGHHARARRGRRDRRAVGRRVRRGDRSGRRERDAGGEDLRVRRVLVHRGQASGRCVSSSYGRP